MADKQTAVEWLTEQINTPQWRTLKRGDIIQQAKQMEKEQIENAFNFGYDQWSIKTYEQYYNETYGKDSTE